MASSSTQPVTIFLENGSYFEGLGWGDFTKPRGAEFVFCTAMTGIEESLTDPSFAAQALVTTASHVGNTGFTGEDMESGQIWAEGLVCRHLETIPSNWRAKSSLGDWIVNSGRFIVSNVDTRNLTVTLREQGSQRGIVALTGSMNVAKAQEYIKKNVPDMDGLDLTGAVTCKEPYAFTGTPGSFWPLKNEYGSGTTARNVHEITPLSIAVWDFGVKQNTMRLLSLMGSKVTVMPATSKAEDILAAGKDGILLSNGPGDPAAATHVIAELKKVLGRTPLFAICLRHQRVAHAAGGSTYKLKFGHRGIHHPVCELDASGKPVRTGITSQNHGFAVDAQKLPTGVRVSFIHGDDESVEGLSLPELNAETVQFHPEAGPGPFEAGVLIRRFLTEAAKRGHS